MTGLRKLNSTLRQFGLELYRGDRALLSYGTTDSRSARDRALRGLARLGYGVRRSYPPDLSPELIETLEAVRPYTMTSQASIVSLCEAVEYVVSSEVGGPIVECGVWRGGSMMAIALTLLRLGADRDLYLFDTFAGMPRPSGADASIVQPDRPPLERWRRDQRESVNEWAYAPLETVRDNVLQTGYPAARVHLVEGMVEQTIPEHAPDSIALLRLDTDWYASTRHELEHLYPRLVARGVLILDDYGQWAGHRKAVDEYPPASALLMHRIDSFARIAVKPGD
jgi:hypothetical protein